MMSSIPTRAESVWSSSFNLSKANAEMVLFSSSAWVAVVVQDVLCDARGLIDRSSDFVVSISPPLAPFLDRINDCHNRHLLQSRPPAHLVAGRCSAVTRRQYGATAAIKSMQCSVRTAIVLERRVLGHVSFQSRLVVHFGDSALMVQHLDCPWPLSGNAGETALDPGFAMRHVQAQQAVARPACLPHGGDPVWCRGCPPVPSLRAQIHVLHDVHHRGAQAVLVESHVQFLPQKRPLVLPRHQPCDLALYRRCPAGDQHLALLICRRRTESGATAITRGTGELGAGGEISTGSEEIAKANPEASSSDRIADRPRRC